MTTTLYHHGRVHCPGDPLATALVVEDATIAWVGGDGAAAAHRDDVDQVVDLDGTFVTPAFVDAHVHTTATGLGLTCLDLFHVSNAEEFLDALARYAEQRRGEVILGHRWDESGWSDPTLPTRVDLDRATDGAVVYLARIDVHSCLASTACIDAANDVRSLSGFHDSGWLSQDAHHAVRAVAFDSIPADQRHDAQRAALAAAAGFGIGMVHELGGPGITNAEDFRELISLGPSVGTPEIVGYWGERGGPAAALSLGAIGAAGDLFIDGAIGSRTALLTRSYEDADGKGVQYLSAAEIRDHVQACSLAGVQAGFHVIGDGAMDVLCAALREVVDNVGVDVVRSARHRFEHVEMLTPDQIALLADLGIVASVQPLFDGLWGGSEGMYSARLGAERAMTLNPFAAMVAAGVPLALGSDAPVTPLGPWEAIRAAAHHHNKELSISVGAAFNAHTRGGWRAAGRDAGGVIAPGQPASLAFWEADDLIVETSQARVANWSTDPRDVVPGLPSVEPEATLPRCLQTIVHGRTVFSGEVDQFRQEMTGESGESP